MLLVAAVVMDSTSFDTVEVAESVTPIKFPYIPGAFILREGAPILHTMRLLRCDFDVLILDGHGVSASTEMRTGFIYRSAN